MAQKKTKKSSKPKAATKQAAPLRKKSLKVAKSSKQAGASKKKVAKTRAPKKVVVKKATSRKKTAKKIVKKAVKKAVKKTVTKPVKSRVKAVPKQPKVVSKTKRKNARGPAVASRISTPSLRSDPLVALALAPHKRVQKLTKPEYAQYRALLIEKRTQLIDDVVTLQNQALSDNRQDAAGDLSSMPIHMADLGSDNYEKEFTLGLIESERTILREIDEALKRIEDGTYGICQATGRPIGKARLKAQPWVKYCYEYVLALEKGQLNSGF